MIHHQNDGSCAQCQAIMDTFPGLYSSLRNWFIIMQAKYTDFHVSEGGRGHVDQERDFAKGASRAHWTESAHNWCAAIDTFFLVDGQYNLDEDRFEVIASECPDFIEWYGAKGSPFYERPHFQIKGWRDLATKGLIQLVG